MGKSPEYLAVSNFFRNTCEIKRSDIKAMLREIIREAVHDEIKRYFETNEFHQHIGKSLGGTFSSYSERLGREGLSRMVADTARKWIDENFEVSIKQKSPEVK